MKRRLAATLATLLLITSAVDAEEESILDVYRAIGDTSYFPLVETLDGHAITNSAGWRLETRIEEQRRFLAYLEEGGGWAVNTYKVWPLANGGAIAATVSASFDVETMYADTYVEFFRRDAAGSWNEIPPPLVHLAPEDFLRRSPSLAGAQAQELLDATDWALYYELRPETDDLAVRLTATNREKCWPEAVFGHSRVSASKASGIDFCRDVHARLTTKLLFRLDPRTGRFEPVEQLRGIPASGDDCARCGAREPRAR